MYKVINIKKIKIKVPINKLKILFESDSVLKFIKLIKFKSCQKKNKNQTTEKNVANTL